MAPTRNPGAGVQPVASHEGLRQKEGLSRFSPRGGAMHERERFEVLLGLLADLAETNRSIPILVEGKRDVEALRALGCGGAIHMLHTGETLHAVAERISLDAREIILMTDWDRKGDTLFATFHALLMAHGVRIDSTFRARIRSWTRLPLKDVESLAGHVAEDVERFRRTSLEEHVDLSVLPAEELSRRLAEEFPPLEGDAAVPMVRSPRPKRRARPREDWAAAAEGGGSSEGASGNA